MSLRRRLGVLAAFLLLAAVWSGSALAAAPAPVNLTLPQISGRADVDSTLVADAGTWTNGPTSFTWTWERCPALTNGSCVDVETTTGPTTSTYPVTSADAGSTLDVKVTATNGSDGNATSDSTLIVPNDSVGSTHFLVHYLTDSGRHLALKDTITQAQAGDIAAWAEQAYEAMAAWGYPAPRGDGTEGGDSRTDIYVENPVSLGTKLLWAVVPETASPSYGYALMNPTILDSNNVSEGLTRHTIAGLAFELMEIGIWTPPSADDWWLLNGAAEWAAFKVDGYQPFAGSTYDLGAWEMSLDCSGSIDSVNCGNDPYQSTGQSRWPFYEYLAERFGNDFFKSVLEQGAVYNFPALMALRDALLAKSANLGDVYTDWSVANLQGDYAVDALKSITPPTYGDSLSTGTLASLNATTPVGGKKVLSGPTPTLRVPIDHLASRYVAIKRGNSDLPDTPCYTATLNLDVTIPSDSGATPYFWWSEQNSDGSFKQKAQKLSVSGTTASITLPWDTCDWGKTLGYLVLANPSAGLDGRNFTVTGTLTVDPNTESAPIPPPDPVSMPGPQLDASAVDGVPDVQIFGPELLHLKASATALRLIVSSSDSGRLRGALGALALGTASLRPGNNDVRFVLPTSTTLALTHTGSPTTVTLSLTPLSSAGTAGTTIVRKVRIEPLATTTKQTLSAKAKAKAKKKTATKRAAAKHRTR